MIKTKLLTDILVKRYGMLAAMAMIGGFLPIVISTYGQHLLTIIIGHAIAVMGLSIILGMGGMLSMSQGFFMAVGAFISALLVKHLAIPFLASFVLALVVAGLIGIGVALPALRMALFSFSIVTFAVSFVGDSLLYGVNLVYRWCGGYVGTSIPVMEIFGIPLEGVPFYYFSLLVLLISMFVYANVRFSRRGRALTAVKDNENLALAMGVATGYYRVLAFTLGSILGAAGGAIVMINAGHLSPAVYSFNKSLMLVAMLVFGGMTSQIGIFVGPAFFLVVPEYLQHIQGLSPALVAAVFLLFLILAPDGVIGLFLRLVSMVAPSVKLFQKKVRSIESTMTQRHERSLNRTELPDLTIEGLTVEFGRIQAVRELDLRIRGGSTHGIIGPNGAGKTTLFNAVSGLIRPARGKIWYRGQNLSSLGAAHRAKFGIGRTFQNPSLMEEMTALENIQLGAFRTGFVTLLEDLLLLPRAVAQEIREENQAIEAMREIGLDLSLADEKISGLPLGVRRLIDIARALSMGSEILLLDEPTSGLGQVEAQRVITALNDIKGKVTLVIVAHHLEFVMGIADVVTVLNFGERIAEGAPQEVRNAPAVIEAYIGKGGKLE